ncbi:hypothetical protein Rhal01_02546 [Rubritalea halochordaticola]|uniref:HEAT repeat domain-containing protein n=1 Tax=Rubritalea halochordaticola TaxID=714537 RepID=A0ABP9V1H7_9BACT
MTTRILTEINSVNWAGYPHPCGQDQGKIPALLTQLLDDQESTAYTAACELWNITAHQGNVGPSAVPLLPLLMDIVPTLSERIQVELFDTLYQFAVAAHVQEPAGWQAELRREFLSFKPQFTAFTESTSEEIRHFAGEIILLLDQ